MTAYFEDTPSEVEAIQLALIRQASAAKRLALVGQMTATVRSLAEAGIRQRHPQATPEEQRRLLADILLGEALARQVYGPPPVLR